MLHIPLTAGSALCCCERGLSLMPSLATGSLGSVGSTVEATPNSLGCSCLCLPQLHAEAWAEWLLHAPYETQVGEEAQEYPPAACGQTRLLGLSGAAGQSYVASGGLLFSSALARAGQCLAGPRAPWGSPVGVNEGHGLEETFWGSIVWLYVMWLQRHKWKQPGKCLPWDLWGPIGGLPLNLVLFLRLQSRAAQFLTSWKGENQCYSVLLLSPTISFLVT